MILLIDNYDSFTWNLYQYFCELGAEVLVRRNDALTLEEIAALAPEKIVISPGPCTPDEAGISLAVIRHYAGKTPLLGVCPRASGDRPGVWRDYRAGGPGHAWQNLAYRA